MIPCISLLNALICDIYKLKRRKGEIRSRISGNQTYNIKIKIIFQEIFIKTDYGRYDSFD